jgi:hypothetical protein
MQRKELKNAMAPEREGSAPCSQEPTTGPYPQPNESSPHPSANVPNIHSDPILPFMPSYQNFVHFSLLAHNIQQQFFFLNLIPPL